MHFAFSTPSMTRATVPSPRGPDENGLATLVTVATHLSPLSLEQPFNLVDKIDATQKSVFKTYVSLELLRAGPGPTGEQRECYRTRIRSLTGHAVSLEEISVIGKPQYEGGPDRVLLKNVDVKQISYSPTPV
jgi:hypothetical protein